MVFKVEDYAALKEAIAEMCREIALRNISDEAAFDCKLVANELLSNALRYGGGSARFTVAFSEDTVQISVKSAHKFVPPKESILAKTDAEGGRGLYLVDAVSSCRGYSEEDGICVVLHI